MLARIKIEINIGCATLFMSSTYNLIKYMNNKYLV